MARSKAPKIPPPDQGSFLEPQYASSTYADPTAPIEFKHVGEKVLAADEIFKPADRHHVPVELPEVAHETFMKTNLLERNARLQEILKDLGYIARTAPSWRAVKEDGTVVDQNLYNSLRGSMSADMMARMSGGNERAIEKLVPKFDSLWGIPKMEDVLRRRGKGEDLKTRKESNFGFKEKVKVIDEDGNDVQDGEGNDMYKDVPAPAMTAPEAVRRDRERFYNRFSNSAEVSRDHYREVSVPEAYKNRKKYRETLEKQEAYLRPMQAADDTRRLLAGRAAAQQPRNFRGRSSK